MKIITMIVLFVFGFMFYKLANQFDKNPWIWAIVGAGSYVAIQLIISVIYGMLIFLGYVELYEKNFIYTLITIGTSSGLVYWGYHTIKKKWEVEDTRFDINQINEIGENKED